MTSPLACRVASVSTSKAGARRTPLVRVTVPDRHASRNATRMSAGPLVRRAFNDSSGSFVSPRRNEPSFA